MCNRGICCSVTTQHPRTRLRRGNDEVPSTLTRIPKTNAILPVVRPKCHYSDYCIEAIIEQIHAIRFFVCGMACAAASSNTIPSSKVVLMF
jgi:hypothetical protein